jgi:tagaturonate reductase
LSVLLESRVRADLPGVTILPCELVEANGDRLRNLVLTDARERGVDPAVLDRIGGSNHWTVTLVDRITTVPSEAESAARSDPFAVVVEPYAAWIVQAAPDARIPEHPAVQRTSDVAPYALRKIRILNGAHTALVERTRHDPDLVVREAMADPAISAWLEALLREEVVPTLADRIVDGDGFVRTVLERFRNPFQDHRLRDIAAGHGDKMAVRLLPTYDEHVARFGRPPRLLGALLASAGLIP